MARKSILDQIESGERMWLISVGWISAEAYRRGLCTKQDPSADPENRLTLTRSFRLI